MVCGSQATSRVVTPLVMFALILLVPTAGAAGGWTQHHGGPDRTGLAVTDLETYDIIATGALDLLQPSWGRSFTHPWLVETPLGLVALDAVSTDTCDLVRFSDPNADPATLLTIDRCGSARLQGYDDQADLIAVCTTGAANQDLLYAIDATTGKIAWTVSGTSTITAVTAQDDPTELGCRGSALDTAEGIWYVAFSAEDVMEANDPVIVALDADTGRQIWAQTPYRDPTSLGPTTGLTVPGSVPFRPEGVTKTATGVVIVGTQFCDVCTPQMTEFVSGDLSGRSQRHMAWIGLNGERLNSYSATDGTDENGLVPSTTLAQVGSAYAAGHGDRVAAVVGTTLVLLDPAHRTPERLAPVAVERPRDDTDAFATPVWTSSHLIVPAGSNLHGVDLHGNADWTYTQGRDLTIDDTLLTGTGDLFVSLSLISGNGRIVEIDPATGRPEAVYPLPFGREPQLTRDVASPEPVLHPTRLTFLPRDDGTIWVHDADGNYAVLGLAPKNERPVIELDTDRPSPGSTLRTSIVVPGTASGKLTVDWGDGTTDTIGFDAERRTAALEHRYSAAETFELRALAVFEDGQTRSSTTAVHVGAPVQTLNFLQTAFSPEKQDLTWGIIGLLVALLGFLLAFGNRLGRQYRLRRALRRVDATANDPRTDIATTVRDLTELRAEFLQQTAHGRLDEPQYQVLVDAIGRHVRCLRMETLGPYLDKVSERYARVLTQSLGDGLLSPRESQTLRAALTRERRLGAEDKRSLAAMLAAWTEADATPGRAQASA